MCTKVSRIWIAAIATIEPISRSLTVPKSSPPSQVRLVVTLRREQAADEVLPAGEDDDDHQIGDQRQIDQRER